MALHDPVFRVGVLSVHPFGLFVAIAIVLGYCLALWRVLRAELPARYLPGMFVVVVLGGFAAARVDYVTAHPEAMRDGLQGVLSLWRGGYSLTGGLIGGALLLVVLTWGRNESPWRWGDALAPAASLGLAVSMLGLPYGGEGWGMPTTGPFYMRVDPQYLPASLLGATRFQPIYAYEAALFGALTVLLLFLSWQQRARGHEGSGTIGLTFLALAAIGYGALRPLTLDASDASLVLRTQALCVVIAACACALLTARILRVRREDALAREVTLMQRAPAARQPFGAALRAAGQRPGGMGGRDRAKM